MASIILFHTAMGLRTVERQAADTFRASGHEVFTPDLYEGQSVDSTAEGIALMNSLGTDLLFERAAAACAGLPDKAILAGLSLGANVACHLWAKRTLTSGLLLLHGLGVIPKWVRNGLPVQIHLADPDPLIPEEHAAEWNDRAFRIGLAAELYTYPDVGHLYTDAASPDYDEAAATLTWARALEFLGGM